MRGPRTRSRGCGASTAGTRSAGAARASGRRTTPGIAPWWTSARASSPALLERSGRLAARRPARARPRLRGRRRAGRAPSLGRPARSPHRHRRPGRRRRARACSLARASLRRGRCHGRSPIATPASISRSASPCSPRSSTTAWHGRLPAKCGACSDPAARSCGTTSASATRGTRTCGACPGGACARCSPGGMATLRLVTLLPPLARRLHALTPVLYPVLAAVPPLRTHWAGLLERPR